MAQEKEVTDFLLRSVPRELWGKVKHKAYEEGVSIREYIINLIERDTKSWRERKTATEK